uniref:subtilisin n=1 Tax=Corethron hystrix TaxID=216773 RepID=A0A7S1BQP8_9STRA
MATAFVSGSAALVRQYFMDGFHPTGKPQKTKKITPSGGLIKAVLINGAQSAIGCNSKYPLKRIKSVPYDEHQGFGAISLIDTLPLKGKNEFNLFIRDQIRLVEGTKKEFKFKMNKKNCNIKKFSVTLTWMDEPGAVGCTSCLINDIDMHVVKNGIRRFYPNGLDGEDHKNNVERIQVPANRNDNFLVVIKGTSFITRATYFSAVATGCFQKVLRG